MRYPRALLPTLKDAPADAPRVKFEDADRIGIPVRSTVPARGLKNGQVELKLRTEADPKKVLLLAHSNAAQSSAQRVRERLAQTATKAN